MKEEWVCLDEGNNIYFGWLGEGVRLVIIDF